MFPRKGCKELFCSSEPPPDRVLVGREPRVEGSWEKVLIGSWLQFPSYGRLMCPVDELETNEVLRGATPPSKPQPFIELPRIRVPHIHP